MRVAYYSPLPPSRSGIADYSALLLPALRERMDVVVARPGRFRRTPKADVRLYHVGNDPVEHGWIVEALERRPGVVVLHEFVLHHLVSGITLARGDVEGYCAALEREAGAEGRELGLAVQQGRIEPLWETRAQEFPLAHGVLDARHRPDRPLALRRGAALATPATSGRSGRCRCRRGRCRRSSSASIGGSPVIGCFGHVNESKRITAALRGVRAVPRTPTGGAPAARRLVVADDCQPIPPPPGVLRQGLRPRGRALVAARRLRRGRLAALADDGRDLRGGGARALLGKPLDRQRRRRASGSCRTRSRSRCRSATGEIEALVEAIRPRCWQPGDERGSEARRRDGAPSRPDGRSLRRGTARRWFRRSPHEGRLLLPAAAVSFRDRRLLGAAAAGAGEADRRRPRTAGSVPARPAGRHRPVPRRQRRRGARLDRRGAPPAARRRRAARLRPPSPRRRPDLCPRRLRRLPGRDGARGRPGRAAARLRRARQQAAAALGDASRGLPARRRGARPRDRAHRPLALRRGARARSRASAGRSRGSRTRPGRCRRSSPPPSQASRCTAASAT